MSLLTNIITPILTLTGVAIAAVILLRWANNRYPKSAQPLVAAIDAQLPQTQCAQCGYPGCRPYAEAIVHQQAPLNLCPPGGPQVEAGLQALMGATATTSLATPVALVAKIDEPLCIGCTLCLPACPVDAIVGASGYTHTVLLTECTGCELCVDPCPVDCIVMVEAST